MNKFNKVVTTKTSGASRNSLAFQSVALGMVKMAMTNGLTGWQRVVALQNLSDKDAMKNLMDLLK